MNWALDVQSAQTLDFYAAMHGGKVAWDLGTLTGISAAVLSAHMKKVTRRTDVLGRIVLYLCLHRAFELACGTRSSGDGIPKGIHFEFHSKCRGLLMQVWV